MSSFFDKYPPLDTELDLSFVSCEKRVLCLTSVVVQQHASCVPSGEEETSAARGSNGSPCFCSNAHSDAQFRITQETKNRRERWLRHHPLHGATVRCRGAASSLVSISGSILRILGGALLARHIRTPWGQTFPSFWPTHPVMPYRRWEILTL